MISPFQGFGPLAAFYSQGVAPGLRYSSPSGYWSARFQDACKMQSLAAALHVALVTRPPNLTPPRSWFLRFGAGSATLPGASRAGRSPAKVELVTRRIQ